MKLRDIQELKATSIINYNGLVIREIEVSGEVFRELRAEFCLAIPVRFCKSTEGKFRLYFVYEGIKVVREEEYECQFDNTADRIKKLEEKVFGLPCVAHERK